MVNATINLSGTSGKARINASAYIHDLKNVEFYTLDSGKVAFGVRYDHHDTDRSSSVTMYISEDVIDDFIEQLKTQKEKNDENS